MDQELEFDRPAWITSRGNIVTSVDDMTEAMQQDKLDNTVKLLLERESIVAALQTGNAEELKRVFRPRPGSVPSLSYTAEVIKSLMKNPELMKQLAMELPKIKWDDLREEGVNEATKAESSRIIALHFPYLGTTARQLIVAVARFMGIPPNYSMPKLMEALKSPPELDLFVAEEIWSLSRFLEDHPSAFDCVFLRAFGNPGNSSLAAFFAVATTRITSLALENCELDINNGLDHLVAALKHPRSTIRKLYLIDNGLEDNDMKKLSDALGSGSCQLDTLCIERNQVSDKGMRYLTEALKSEHCTIRNLSLDHAAADFNPLWDALQNPNKLDKLSAVSYGEASPMIANALQDPAHCNLQHLKLRFRMGSDSAMHIAKSIKTSKLESLDWLTPEIENEKVEDFVDSIVESKITNLAWGTSSKPNRAKIVSKMVSSESSIQSFKWVQNSPGDSLTAREQETVLDAVGGNPNSCILSLDLGKMKSKDLEHKRDVILKENQFKKELMEEREETVEEVPAPVAKLIICGESGAGKTTILTSLRAAPSRLLPIQMVRECFGQTAAVRYVELEDHKLVTLDVGGADKFQPFHQHFFKCSEKSLFLVVCKVDKKQPKDSVDTTLRYWLRLINSHRSQKWTKLPKVLIVLNYSFKKPSEDTRALHAAKRVADEFSAALGMHNNYEIFEFVPSFNMSKARKGVQPLRKTLKSELDNMHVTIPKQCQEILNQKQALTKKQSVAPRIVPVDYFDQHKQGTLMQLAMESMDQMGEAIYLGHHIFNPTQVNVSYAIFDVEWFLKKVLSVFLKQKHWQPSNSGVDTEDVKFVLRRKCGISEEHHIDFLLQCLQEMGVIIPWDDTWNKDWSSPPRHVKIPSLLQTLNFPLWPILEPTFVYWGRRFECKDKFTVFPPGIFTIIQSKINMFGKDKSHELGNNWLSFVENGISVIVRIGGRTFPGKRSITQLEWIDVLVISPSKDKQVQAEVLMESTKQQIYDLVTTECTYLSLEEKVICPSNIRSILQRDINPDHESVRTIPLHTVQELAREKGLNYTYSWNMHIQNDITELMMASELQDYLKDRYEEMAYVLDEYEETVRPAFHTEHITDYQAPKFEDQELQKMCDFLSAKIDEVKADTSQIKADLKDIKQAVDRLEGHIAHYGEKILANCTRILTNMRVNAPRYPYVTSTERSSTFKRYCTLKETVRIHYMCEARGHRVTDSKGVSVGFPKDWIKQYANVLVPALTILFFATKVAISSFGPVGKIGDLIQQVGERKLMDFLNECMFQPGGNEFISTLQEPTSKQVEDVFNIVKTKLGRQEVDRHAMVEHFGLHLKELTDGNHLWVCGEHKM